MLDVHGVQNNQTEEKGDNVTTLAISPKRVRLYRGLWDRWIIILRILFDLGAGAHPVKIRAVADTLLVDKKTCQKYMAGLVREGRITAAGDGFMLTQAGMDVLLENERGEFLPSQGINPDSGENFSPPEPPETDESGQNSTPEPSQTGINPEIGENFSPLKIVKTVVVDSESKTLTTTTAKRGEFLPGEFYSPEVQQALAQVPVLFDGAEVSLRGLPANLHIEKVLGWIAYAYDQRARLNSPCGLIYTRLRDESKSPYIKYMRAPENYLPEDYLRAIDRWQESEQVDVVPEETPEPRQESDWRKVALEIDGKIKHAVFTSWEESWWQGDVLQVAVREGRVNELNRTVAEMAGKVLSSMVGRSVQVRFVGMEAER